MIIAPFNTDAPIYHRPIGTVSLIVLSALVTLLLPHDLSQQFALSYGNGLTPLQWVTSLFVHGGIIHLLGNMFFLWGFGLIVEGKLGWSRFIPLYLVIGAAESAIEQFAFSQQEGMSFGASSAIFGLMAVSLIWAPRNELSVFYWLGLKAGVADVSVALFSSLLFLKSLLFCGFTGVAPTTELLHLLGAIVGTIVGLIFLRWRWVDCEDWDLISVLQGKRPTLPLSTEPMVPKATSELKRPSSDRVPLNQSEAKFSEFLHADKPHAAVNQLRLIRQEHRTWSPPPEEWLLLARAFRKRKAWDSAISYYKEYLKSASQIDDRTRMEIAEILILIVERPQAALNLLAPVDESQLDEKLQTRLSGLRKRALQLIDDGVLEMRDDQWDLG